MGVAVEVAELVGLPATTALMELGDPPQAVSRNATAAADATSVVLFEPFRREPPAETDSPFLRARCGRERFFLVFIYAS
ncbi:hypothetical protein [Arthrobacter sp. AFG7.2]|uniref:hypothetical protein n=1 Tax=Arthrobacter sp. AFG7.2 TaxID=1688693 RepID=UPI001CB9AD47|nr:hypothetical protein [Arthrobacter sp. AFG7.2]